MDLRNHVRRLTMAALQFPKSHGTAGGDTVRARIEHRCVELSLLVQSGEHQRTIASARKLTDPLGELLAEAYRLGVFGSFELALMVRELSDINETLSALSAQ